MIRRPITFPHCAPLTRRGAALLVQEASRYESRLMIEHDAKIVNAKSMLGLLSLGADAQSRLQLLAEGPDEEAAAEEGRVVEVRLAHRLAHLAGGIDSQPVGVNAIGHPAVLPAAADGEVDAADDLLGFHSFRGIFHHIRKIAQPQRVIAGYAVRREQRDPAGRDLRAAPHHLTGQLLYLLQQTHSQKLLSPEPAQG